MPQAETAAGLGIHEFTQSRNNASFQVIVTPEHIGWIHAALLNTPYVELYSGGFVPPFESLSVVTSRRGNQLISQSTIKIDGEFDDQVGTGIGNDDVIRRLTKRYPQSQVSDDRNQLLLVNKRGEASGIIIRDGDEVTVHTGGQAGQIDISDSSPVNDISVGLAKHTLLLQRYISAVLRSTDAYATQLALQLLIPQLPEGAAQTYFSTREVVLKEFREHPRPLDLIRDIGGYQKAKDAVQSIFLDLVSPNVSRQHGTKPFSDKFILLTGREGTGKTLFAKGLDTLMRQHFNEADGKSPLEHLRVPFGDMLTKYGASTIQVLGTIFEQARENERNGVPTLIHLDGLHALISPLERTGRVLPNGEARIRPTPTESEFNFEIRVLGPIRGLIREFGAELGANSKHVVMFGESREERAELPESIAKTFRRTIDLDPTVDDLGKIIDVQTTITRANAEGTGVDPFAPGFDAEIARIAKEAEGLTGFNVKQALIHVTSHNKAAWDGDTQRLVTADDLIIELRSMKGVEAKVKRGIGFVDFSRQK